MTRFFSELCFVEGADGTLEPVADEPPLPLAAEPEAL